MTSTVKTLKFKPNLKKISHLKKAHKVTNRQIARKQKVSEQWVSVVIHGKGESSPLKDAIAKALRVDRQEIFPEKKKAA